MSAQSVRGSLPEIFGNHAGLYDGDLVHYLQIVFNAPNRNHPYHNFRHMTHVTFLCYAACIYYRDKLTARKIRNLLIAAMYHDYGHLGVSGDDAENIELAIAALERDIRPVDRPYLGDIAFLMRATEYHPDKNPPRLVTDDLCAQILQDADMSQAFSVAWIQQVIFGLAAEWRMEPIALLRMQEGFLGKLSFNTAWARDLFPQTLINDKIREANELLGMLEQKPATAAA